jgi:hypothetical protein
MWMKVLDNLSKAQKLVKDRPIYTADTLPKDSIQCIGKDGKPYVLTLWSDKGIDF